MNILNWFKNRKIKNRVNRFFNLIEAEDIAPAIDYYREILLPLRSSLSREARSAYHFLNWTIFRSKQDEDALRQLGVNQKSQSAIRRIVKFTRSVKAWNQFGECIRTPEKTDLPEYFDEYKGYDIERIGVRLFENLRDDNSDTVKVATTDKSLTDYLEYVKLIKLLSDQPDLFGEKTTRLRMTFSVKAVFLASQLGHIKKAITVYQLVLKSSTENEVKAWVGATAYALVQKNKAEFAIQWLNYHIAETRKTRTYSQAFITKLKITKAIALFFDRKNKEGREVLDEIEKDIATTSDPETTSHSKIDLDYWRCLSFIAETADWSDPGNEKEEQKVHQIRRQNQLMWVKVKSSMDKYLDPLLNTTGTSNWQAQLLNGLLAYAESGAKLDQSQLDTFSLSVNNIKSEKVRNRLNHIKGNLLERLQATDAAISLIERKAYQELFDFKKTVLDPLGQSIPPLIRASVYMTIWEQFPSYDPLPDIKKISPTLEEEGWINKCIEQVQLHQATLELTSACRGITDDKSSNDLLIPANLKWSPVALGMGTIVAWILQLKNQQWDTVVSMADNIDPASDPSVVLLIRYLTFYTAWKTNDYPTLHQIQSKGDNPYLADVANLEDSLLVQQLLYKLKHKQGEKEILGTLYTIKEKKKWSGLPNMLLALLIWMIRHRYFSHAIALMDLAKHAQSPPFKNFYKAFGWLFPMLEGMVFAKQEQYRFANESFLAFITNGANQSTAVHPVINYSNLAGWAKLFNIQTELILLCQFSDEEAKARWSNYHQLFYKKSDSLKLHQGMKSYAFLLEGFLAAFDSEITISNATIQNLKKALLDLNISGKSDFLNKLVWKRDVINNFWELLNDEKYSELIQYYQEQVIPLFRQQIPRDIQVALIFTEWILRIHTTDQAKQQLLLLQNQYPDLTEIVDRSLEAIHEEEHVRKISDQLGQKEYDVARELINEREWLNLKKGSMPFPVAISLFLCFYKTGEKDNALQFGESLSSNEGYPTWFKNYSRLVYGYTLLDKKNFKEAVAVFEELLRNNNILGHDIEKYYAVANFSRGLQLLEVDQLEEAFDAFAKSIDKMPVGVENVKLAALCLHLGLTKLEIKNGTKALNAFKLFRDSLGSKKLEDAEATYFKLIAEMGTLLCNALIEKNRTPPRGSAFLDLLEKVEDPELKISPQLKATFSRSLRILSLCQDLKNFGKVINNKNLKTIDRQIKALEKLQTEIKMHDPLLLLLKALVELKLKRTTNVKQPMEWIKSAKQLGLDSRELNEYMNTQLKDIVDIMAGNKLMSEMFDLYLVGSSIANPVKKQLVDNEELASFYRLNKNYIPLEIVQANTKKDGLEIFYLRLNHLKERLEKEPLKNDASLQSLKQQLESGIEKLLELEKKLTKVESEILNVLFEKINKQHSPEKVN